MMLALIGWFGFAVLWLAIGGSALISHRESCGFTGHKQLWWEAVSCVAFGAPQLVIAICGEAYSAMRSKQDSRT